MAVRELLVCPACREPLVDSGESDFLVGMACGHTYPIRNGVPIMLAPELRRPAEVGTTHKASQIEFFDQDPGDDFGVIRPRGAPRLYGWLMREKFRRSVVGLESLLPGSTVLVICGGSGLDAEFLVHAGASVILSDISLGVVLQARERSRRFGLELGLVVADAEALPFRDDAVDVVYVHDGLHHLEHPELGLAEMARVARHAVSVSEPSASSVTRAAARIGFAQDIEEAGNPVRRLKLEEITGGLRARGFRPIKPHRYAMFYRHWPGRTMRTFSLPILYPLGVAAIRAWNGILGRFGNKLTVQARRIPG